MSTVASILVTLDDGSTFNVDTAKDCCLFWSDAGWQVLADYYDLKGEGEKAKEVRQKKCPKAKPKGGEVAAAPATDAVIALKDPLCDPTEWP
jgi:hypothetical protein